MIVVRGDLFTSEGSLGHGVNAKGLMSSGIAVEFRNRYPMMHDRYVTMCENGELLGGDLYAYDDGGGRFIYNMVSQVLPGANASLDLIAKSASKALNHADSHNIRTISIPKIGSGVGGLDWYDVRQVLKQVERNRRAYFTVFEL